MRGTMRGALALAAAGALAAGAARADATVKDRTVFEGIGDAGRMSREGTGTVLVSGDKMRQETSTKPTGRMMQRLGNASGRTGTTITRLDRRLLYRLNPRDGTFIELPIESLKDLDPAGPGTSARGGAAGAAPRRPLVLCDPVKVASKRTGQKQSVNGFPAEEAVLEGTQACHGEDAKQACTMHYVLDAWETPATPSLRELQAFYGKLAGALGADPRELEAASDATRGAMSHLGDGFAALYRALATQPGFPVRYRLSVESEGTCGLPGLGGRGGGALGAPAGFGGMRAQGRGMGGRGRAATGPAPPGDDATAATTRHKVFALSHEIESATAAAAPAGSFDPPAGYSKREPAKRAPAEPMKAAPSRGGPPAPPGAAPADPASGAAPAPSTPR